MFIWKKNLKENFDNRKQSIIDKGKGSLRKTFNILNNLKQTWGWGNKRKNNKWKCYKSGEFQF